MRSDSITDANQRQIIQ